jgi:hypothetical protein
VLPTPSPLTPQLRRAGYFIALATIFTQLSEVFLRSWPFRFLSPAWRISLVSSVSSITPTLLLMAFVLVAIAIFAGNRPLSLVFSGFAFLAAICCLLMSGTLMLDAIQMRNQVRTAVARQYDITTLWTLFRVVIGLAGFLMLGLASLRSAMAMRAQTARQTKRTGTLIGTNPPTPAPRVGESTGVKGT